MIFFVHIPKTAGTSLLECFKTLAGRSLLWYAADLDLEHELPKAPVEILADPEIRKRFTVYGGHFGLQQLRPYLQNDDLIVSVVREPVSRAYSFYNHVIFNDLRHSLRPKILGKSIIEAAIANQTFLGQIENQQCWFISGQKTFGAARQIIDRGEILVYDISDAQALVQVVADRLGVKGAPVLPSLNESKRAGYLEEMTQEEVGFLKGLTIHDQRLYDYVRSHAGIEQ